MAQPPRPAQWEVPDFSNPAHYRSQQSLTPAGTRSLPESRFWKALTFLDDDKKEGAFNFLSSRAGFGDETQDDWQPSRHLGSGGFGAAGAWVKKDDKGTVIDEIAVKELRNEKYARHQGMLRDQLWHSSNLHLFREAVIQRQLNLAKCENVVHLRGYKSFIINPNDNSQNLRRYYMELAPYGDFYGLMRRYRYYSCFLPEPFLWHVFDSLAAAAEVMSTCSQTGLPPRNRQINPSDEVVNFDMKTSNVFLSYAERHQGSDPSKYGGTKKYDYPVIKMGDLGGAFFTGPEDRYNPSMFFRVGTPFARPPEQVHYGIDWKHAPNGPYAGIRHFNDDDEDSVMDDSGEFALPPGFRTNVPQNYNFKLSQKVHVWAIGAMIYELMSLTEIEEYWTHSAKSYADFESNGQRQIESFTGTPFNHAVTRQSPYSGALTNLVERCMEPSESLRLNVNELRKQTRNGMNTWDQKWTAGCEVVNGNSPTVGATHPKLYWRQDELNDLPQGSEDFLQSWDEYRHMQYYHNYDPDWPALEPNFKQHLGLPNDVLLTSSHNEYWKTIMSQHKKWLRNHFDINNGQIHLKPQGTATTQTDGQPPPNPPADDNSDGSGNGQDEDEDDDDDGRPDQGGAGAGRPASHGMPTRGTNLSRPPVSRLTSGPTSSSIARRNEDFRDLARDLMGVPSQSNSQIPAVRILGRTPRGTPPAPSTGNTPRHTPPGYPPPPPTPSTGKAPWASLFSSYSTFSSLGSVPQRPPTPPAPPPRPPPGPLPPYPSVPYERLKRSLRDESNYRWALKPGRKDPWPRQQRKPKTDKVEKPKAKKRVRRGHGWTRQKAATKRDRQAEKRARDQAAELAAKAAAALPLLPGSSSSPRPPAASTRPRSPPAPQHSHTSNPPDGSHRRSGGSSRQSSAPAASPSHAYGPRSAWTADFTEAYNNAGQNGRPPLPPNIDPTDTAFRWSPAFSSYTWDQQGQIHWWDARNLRWTLVEVWPDTPQNRALNRVGRPRIRGG